MSQPFIGEIRMFGGSFAPAGWAFCDGQLMPISQNDALFTLIGTTYGGDGQETFGLPNLQSRIPMHSGTGGGGTYTLGESGGVESVTLTTQQIPVHNHPPLALTTPGSNGSPQNGIWAQSQSGNFALSAPSVAMAGPSAITGGGQPHDNMVPYLVISFILSLFGIFPPPQ